MNDRQAQFTDLDRALQVASEAAREAGAFLL